MRLLFFFALLISTSLFGQERYAFVHFPGSMAPSEINTFLADTDAVVFGRLSDRSSWALLDASVEKVTRLKSKYDTDVVFWNQRKGSVCDLKLYGEDVGLTFVKYNSHITKFNVQDLPKLFRLHDEHINKINKTGNILLEGFLDNDDGGFLLMMGTVDKKVISTDPAVVNGIIEPEVQLTSVQVKKGCH
ncbi:MAG: hypothetical protein AAGF85_08245 [Bacteroidota bacterium]